MRFLLILTLLISGCEYRDIQPNNINDVCSIFADRPDWLEDSKRSSKKWNAPIELMMAIMYQESSFRKYAQPNRSKLFGIIPWLRPNDAIGYAQAIGITWNEYRERTGNKYGDRTNFADAIDFMGWYIKQSRLRSKIKNSQSYEQYLAYHEGHGGFNRKTYNTDSKKWLREAAKKVAARRIEFKKQLQDCGILSKAVAKKGLFDYLADIKY